MLFRLKRLDPLSHLSFAFTLVPFFYLALGKVDPYSNALVAFFCELLFVFLIYKARPSFRSREYSFFLASSVSLLIADTLYNFEFFFPNLVSVIDPKKIVSETFYPLFLIFLNLFIFHRIRTIVKRPVFFLVFLCGFLFNFVLTAKYVLLPFYSRIDPTPIVYNVIATTVYSFFSAAVFGLVVASSLGVFRTKDFLFLMGICIFQLSDISLRNTSLKNSVPVFGWPDVGWNLGISLMVFSFSQFRLGEVILDKKFIVRDFNSIRILTALSMSTASLFLLTGVGFLGSIQISSLMKLSTIMFLFFIVWAISNYLALKIFNAMEKLLLAMESGLLQIKDGLKTQNALQIMKLEGVSTGLVEVDFLAKRYNNLVDQTNSLLNTHFEQSKKKALFDLANQVAHDIRSPLAALQFLEGSLKLDNSNDRNLFSKSLVRVKEIANKLLLNSKAPEVFLNMGSEKTNPLKVDFEFLKRETELLIAEKKVGLKNPIELKTEFVCSIESPEIPLSFQLPFKSVDFSTTLSNLLQNSIDSIEIFPGEVKLQLDVRPKGLALTIEDTGRGIPEFVLEKLGTQHFSFGKPDGNGLGFFQVKGFVENMGGRISVQSHLNRGTQIFIEIPLSCKLPAPHWN